MSQFTVQPDEVAAAGTRLGSVSGEVLTMHAAVGALAGGAAGTPAAGAFEDMLGQWRSVLPHFARSGASLSASVSSAAVRYRAVDQGVTDSAS